MRVLKSLLLAAAAVVSTAASTVSAGGGGSKSTSTSTTSTTTSTTAAASTPATTTIVASLSALPILTVSGSSIVEASTNRSVFLHGVNLAAKAPPFRAIDTSSPAAIAAALDPIAAAGYNVVRLAFTWEAYEGTQGVYDQNYLQYYVTLVRELRKRGVYTLVDFHQDGFSRFSLNGCGEGAPEWAVLAAGKNDPANYTSADSLKQHLCPIWGIMLQIQALIPGNVNANFANVMQAGGALQAQYMKMVQSVAAALLNETGVMGFEIMNEPFLLLPGFNEAGAKALAAAGWVDPIVVVEAPFANVTKVRPAGIKNIVYGPHHYNWRFILDPLETQLRYWLQEGGLINPVKAFADAPSEKTMNDMMHHFTFFHNATSVLALNLAAQSADNAVVANFMDNAAKMSDYSAQVQSHGNAILNSPGSLLAAIEKGVLVAIVTLVVELFNGICFTPAIGLFSLLRAILPLLPPDTDAAVATMVSDAKSAYGGAPVLVGEFGCNAGAAYLHCDTWTHSLASSADAAKATGWIQWAYVPQWSDALKDVFNLEDLSVTTGVSGGYAKRQTFIQGRPLVRALAGSLTALTTAVGKGTVQYVTAGAVGAVSEIFFDEAVACGTGKTAAIAVQGSASCAYATGGRSLVLCSSTAANVNVTVTLSC